MRYKQGSIPVLSKEDEARFWAKVSIGPDEACWPWQGATANGYGKFKLAGRSVYAHRISFAIRYGDSPRLFICHRCDNPSCVNPGHLWDQTAQENIQEASDRNRLKRKKDWRKARGLHPDFPLFPHGDPDRPDRLRWAKKVRGKLVYFGKVETDPKGVKALETWLRDKDDLIAGRTPRAKVEGADLRDLCNKFLQAKDRQLAAGEITIRTRADYERTTDRLIEFFGKSRLVVDLAAEDFEKLRAEIAKTCGPVALGNEIGRIRVAFKYAFDAGVIQSPIRYGAMFKKPSKKVLRLNRKKKGLRLFDAEQIHKLIAAAEPQLAAMIYLAINCGFGNNDVGTLPLSALDLKGGWLDYHRPKTGVDRRCPLWPETVLALQVAIEQRTTPKTDAAKGLVFVTRYGAPWFKETSDNPVCQAFRGVLDRTGIYRPGLSYYSLRHVFRTVADESKDQPACNAIMGHIESGMASTYRERISDERLQAVVDYVRSWLLKGVRNG